jgi:hypothetical protein
MEVTSHFLQMVEFLGQVFQKYSGIKFNGNPSSGSRVVSYGWMDTQTGSTHNEVISRF